MPTLVELFYYVFLAIFAMTAIVSIGSVVNIRPFDKVQEKYRSWLFTILIVEVVGAVVLVFNSLPTPGEPVVKLYRFEADYRNYVQEWTASLDDGERACLAEGAPLNDVCAQVQSERAAANIAANKTGEGNLLLVGKIGEPPLWGVLVYEFPGAADPTAIRVTVSDSSDENLDLRFIQAERPLVRNGKVFLRPQSSYAIRFASTKNGRLMVGDVLHPTRTDSDGAPLTIAKATLIPEM